MNVGRTEAPNYDTKITVLNTTTLKAASAMDNPVALNFASARNPGGGFIGGSEAQEESLARVSGLYHSLKNNEMYKFHRSQKDPAYSSYAIYSPDVPVFKDEAGNLLQEPWLCSFVTAPAINANGVRSRNSMTEAEIKKEMTHRIRRVLNISITNGHENIVLGAWGCGVFGNKAEMIADIFNALLRTEFKGTFRSIIFAVLDTSDKKKTIGAFLPLAN